MMASLDNLLDIEGVVAAGEFAADGPLVDYKARMDMSEELAQMTAQFCATVTMMFNTLAGSFTQLSGMNWVPQQGVFWWRVDGRHRRQPGCVHTDGRSRLQPVVRSPCRQPVT
jgi:roadblock/LC7 domain-containing protein